MSRSPSGAHVWVHCPGQPELAEQLPKEPRDPRADEGVKAHAMASDVLLGDASLGNSEMAQHVGLYIDYVQSLEGELQVERWLDIPIGEGMRGCADAIVDGTHVVDFKYGEGPIEAVGNWQLLSYAWALPPQDEYQLTIVQPRAYHPEGPIRTWSVTRAELRRYVAQMMGASLGGDLRTGSHCRNCVVRPHCPALRGDVSAQIDHLAVAAELDHLPLDAAGRELARIVQAEKLLSSRRAALEATLEQALKGGQSVDGWTIKASRGSRVWTVTEEEILALGEAIGIDLATPREAVSVAQAEKRKLGKTLLDQFTTKIPGRAKLTQVSTGTEVFTSD